MIRRITFENYKAFDGKCEIEIRPITLFIGKNSSGKTSLCKLFPLLNSILFDSLKHNAENNTIGIETFRNHDIYNLSFAIKTTKDAELEMSFLMNKGIVYYKVLKYWDENGLKTLDLITQKQEVYNEVDTVNDFLSKYSVNIEDFDLSSCYLGPIRDSLSNNIVKYNGENGTYVGIRGDKAYPILINSYKKGTDLCKNVSNWLKENLEGQVLMIKEIPESFQSNYSFTVLRSGVEVPINNVGQGLSQVLPVIVQSFLEPKEPFTIIEEPELHLHPAAHAKVAERLALSAKEQNKCYILETHSENILLSVRRMVADSSFPLKSEDVIVYFIDNDEQGSYLEKIEVKDNGELTSWPTGVFGESFELMSKILNNGK